MGMFSAFSESGHFACPEKQILNLIENAQLIKRPDDVIVSSHDSLLARCNPEVALFEFLNRESCLTLEIASWDGYNN